MQIFRDGSIEKYFDFFDFALMARYQFKFIIESIDYNKKTKKEVL